MRTPRLEKHEQADIQQLLQAVGGKVYVLGTRRSAGRPCPKCGTFVPEGQSTRQTPGMADLVSFVPIRQRGDRRAQLAMIECKRQGREDRLTTEQREFQQWCEVAGVVHLVASTMTVVADWLRAEGVIR